MSHKPLPTVNLIIDQKSTPLNWIKANGGIASDEEGKLVEVSMYRIPWQTAHIREQENKDQIIAGIQELNRLTMPGDWGLLRMWEADPTIVRGHKLQPRVFIWCGRHLDPRMDDGNHAQPFHIHRINSLNTTEVPQPLYWPRADNPWIYSDILVMQTDLWKYWDWDGKKALI